MATTLSSAETPAAGIHARGELSNTVGVKALTGTDMSGESRRSHQIGSGSSERRATRTGSIGAGRSGKDSRVEMQLLLEPSSKLPTVFHQVISALHNFSRRQSELEAKILVVIENLNLIRNSPSISRRNEHP